MKSKVHYSHAEINEYGNGMEVGVKDNELVLLIHAMYIVCM